MRRKNNAYNEEITLFVGTTRIIIVNGNRQIDYAFRTVRLTEKILYTYHNPLTSVASSQLNSAIKYKNPNSSLSLQQLVKYEFQYKITTNMRPKLLLSLHDKDNEEILDYLKKLKAPDLKSKNKETYHIVAIAIEDQSDNIINGFIFTEAEQAILFYQSVNQAIASQIYFQLAQTASLPYNYKLSNLLGDTLNGRCVIDPQDFSQEKTQQQVGLQYDILRLIAKESLYNFRHEMFQLQLKFRIVDDESKNYACNFISQLQRRVQKLTLDHCQLNNNQFTTVLFLEPFKLIEKLQSLLCLDLSNNNLSDDFFTTASNMLRHSKKLHSLNLSYNVVTLQKQASISSFLQQVLMFKLKLNLANNQIKNTQAIIKYFINAEGSIPLESLDISNNIFEAQNLVFIAKTYLERKRNSPQYALNLIINQLEFQEISSFDFLTMQHRQVLPTALSIPLSLSKHPLRKGGKQLGNSEQQLKRFNIIDDLFKEYGKQIYLGNFYKMKQLKDQLKKLGVQQQAIYGQTKQLQAQRNAQEKMIIKKMEKVLNFDLKIKDIIKDFNQSLMYVRRKKLSGQGVNCLAYIKFKIQENIKKLQKENNLAYPFNQLFFNYNNKYQYLFQNDSDLLQTRSKYLLLLKTNTQDLTKLMLAQQKNPNANTFIAYKYLNLKTLPEKIQRHLLQQCLTDPLLSSVKILRDSNIKPIQLYETQRIAKTFPHPKKSQIQIVSNYGLQSYRFSQAFVQSGLSSSGYNGMLSCCKFEVQYEGDINKFLQIFNNFMELLYQTPDSISDNSISYIIGISTYLIQRQNQKQNDLKSLLVEELIIRMMTFFDTQRHRPLKRGLLLSICEFLLRRVQVQEQLIYRLTAYLIKIDSYKQQQMKFHISANKLPWQGKVDWKVRDTVITKELIMNRGKIKVSIAGMSNQYMETLIQIDELETVADLWAHVRENMQKIADYTYINKNQLNFYWICGTKVPGQSWDFQFLPSYQHIGKLIFQDKFQRKFFLRRTLYPPQFHSSTYLKQMKYQDLLCLFSQVRQNFIYSADIMLSQALQTTKIKLIVDIIWIQTLIEQQILLNVLRRQQNDQAKYRNEREKIINQLLGKLKEKYIPANSILNEENRNSLIFEVRAKINEPIPKIISQVIKERVINLVTDLGICAYTTALTDPSNKYTFYCNNKMICFQDKSQNTAKRLYIQFKNLLGLQVVNQEQAYLKIDTIQNIHQGKLERYRFSLCGSSCWLGQIYAMIVSICSIRVSFPNNLLSAMEDSKYGVLHSVLVSEMSYMLHSPALQTSKYLRFSLPRKKAQPIIQHFQKEPSQLIKQTQKEKLPKQQNFEERQESLPAVNFNMVPEEMFSPIPTIEQKSVEPSSKKQPEKSLQIQHIIEAVPNGYQPQLQIITGKRNSLKNAPTSRRRSRNR